MINIAVVGCGNWASKIINEINIHNKFNLRSIVCRKKKENIPKIIIFDSIDKMINSKINDCIYVAAEPKLNLEIVKLIKNYKIPIILEKPISDSYENIEELKKILEKYNLIALPNLTNYFSESFFELKKITDEKYKKINEIIIYEGGFGPFRKNIHPIWDWGFHSISLLFLLFEPEKLTNINMKIIKSNNLYGKGIVSKFSFKINKKIKVKIITGNLFKKKLRKMKIKFKDNTFILNDMIKHKLYFDNKLIFANKITPVSSLLNNFEKIIQLNKNEVSRELINISCMTTKFLEKFFKC